MREPKKTANHIDNILSLEDFLPYQLSILSNRVSSTIATAYQDKFALTVTEWRIMAVLGETMGVGSPDVAGVSADTVSQRTQVEKSLISRAIKRLLARNLVRRETDAQGRTQALLTFITNRAGHIPPSGYRYRKRTSKNFSLVCLTASGTLFID